MKTIKLKERGITLIALVITIVVLIILATISINMILDDNGIIGAAELAKEKYQNAAQKEKEDMYGLEEYVEESVGIVPTVEELQSRYEFEYYSSMVAAVNDVNNGTIGENADVDKDNAVAGIYTKEEETYVVLLKDAKEESRIAPTVDLTINLGGYVFSTSDKVGINVENTNVIIDGRLEGSGVEVNRTDGGNAKPIQLVSGSCIVNGGNYIGNSSGASASDCVAVLGGSLNISNATLKGTDNDGTIVGILVNTNSTSIITNCNIEVNSKQGICHGVGTVSATEKEGGRAIVTNCNIKVTSNEGIVFGINNNGNANISNCDIIATTTDGKAYATSNNGIGSISNCNIKAYSNYTTDGENYQALSQGVRNVGNLTINDCYVMGTHSGVSNEGKLYVNGGIYEGYGHGGFYFEGTGITSYVRNATIRECAMSEGYTTSSGMNNKAGFYIGGAAGNDNIKVYMDNCDIYGSVQPIVLRGSASEKNNSLYISNSKINIDKKIRIDNDTHKLYIGVGNNFTAANTTLPSAVETTDETYIQN